MPRTVYSPEFKAKIVIEVLEGARELEAIAADYQLNPNMFGNGNRNSYRTRGRHSSSRITEPKKLGGRKGNGRKRMSDCSGPWAS